MVNLMWKCKNVFVASEWRDSDQEYDFSEMQRTYRQNKDGPSNGCGAQECEV